MASKIFKRKIPVSIYSRYANLCVVKNMEDMQAQLDKKCNGMINVMDADGVVFELFSSKGHEYYIVLVEEQLSHNLIAHEVFHLAVKMTSDIEIKDEESTAWLIGYLTEEVYKVLKSKNYNIKEQ